MEFSSRRNSSKRRGRMGEQKRERSTEGGPDLRGSLRRLLLELSSTGAGWQHTKADTGVAWILAQLPQMLQVWLKLLPAGIDGGRRTLQARLWGTWSPERLCLALDPTVGQRCGLRFWFFLLCFHALQRVIDDLLSPFLLLERVL